MFKWFKKGFVSVELVIMAAIILTSGIAGIVAMGDKGSQAMQDGMDKLASLGVFGGEVATPSFSSTWYHPSLNVEEGDVNTTSDFVFVLNPDGTTYTITDYTNTADKTVVIPKFHNDGKTITGLGDYSFQGMGLTSVALHNAINTIGDYAFEGNELEVLYFSDYAVASMPRRGMVYTSSVGGGLGDGLEIGAHAFANNNLTDVKLANGLTVVGDSAFENNVLTAVVLPNTTKELGSKAFFNNQIAEIVLPVSITSIGDYSFKNNELGAVTFEGTLPTVLGADIFGANDGLVLRTVKVPSGQLNTFKSAATLLGVQTYALYDPAIPHDPLAYDGTWYDASLKISEADINPISDFTFVLDAVTNTYVLTGYTNTTDKTVVIPNFYTDGKLITAIANDAFREKWITSVALPSNLKTIGATAFYKNNLTNIIFPNTVTAIGSSAFHTNLLESVALSNELKTISVGAFYNNKLTEVVIPNKVSDIGQQIFSANPLTSVTFLGTKPTITINTAGYSVFHDIPTLSAGSVKVPSAYLDAYKSAYVQLGLVSTHFTVDPNDSNVEGGIWYRWNTTLNGWEAYGCVPNIGKAIVIPSTRADGKPIVSIADQTFREMGLTSVVLNSNLKSIGATAFFKNNLTNIIFPNTVTAIGSSAFSINLLESITLSSELKTISAGAFYSNKLTEVVIPNKVSDIGQQIFSANPLTSVTFLGTKPTITINTAGYSVFHDIPTLSAGSVKVPSAYLNSYKSDALNFGVATTHFVGY